ncbi:MAG: hypothetical protein BV456_10565 [Thermoplasmata archaeon M8B2D]|nr:MAG: hypothetical protein BV456_10565 [Thermoplasmata archaeon M8B2D]
MIDPISFFKELHLDYEKSTLEELVGQITFVYKYSYQLANDFDLAKKEENLNHNDFFQLWHPFVDNFVVWSSQFNREVKKRIYENNIDDIFLFQKYCFIYQHWWILFHLVTKHYSNYRREKLIELENKLKNKIESLVEAINSKEIIKGFSKNELDQMFSWDQNGQINESQ